MDDLFSKIQTATYISQKESHMTSIYVLRKIHSIFAIFNGEYKIYCVSKYSKSKKKSYTVTPRPPHTHIYTLFKKMFASRSNFTFHFRSEKISWLMSFVEMKGQMSFGKPMPPNLAGNK